MRPEVCPKCGGEIMMVEYAYDNPQHYDGISEYVCYNAFKMTRDIPTCDYRVGRWCGKELQSRELETRFCKGEPHQTYEDNKSSQ